METSPVPPHFDGRYAWVFEGPKAEKLETWQEMDGRLVNESFSVPRRIGKTRCQTEKCGFGDTSFFSVPMRN